MHYITINQDKMFIDALQYDVKITVILTLCGLFICDNHTPENKPSYVLEYMFIEML